MKFFKTVVRATAIGIALSIMGFKIVSNDPKVPARPTETMVLIVLFNLMCNYPDKD